jgi:hypothetical protein
MAELEVATKVPESDAAVDASASLVPGDTPAQSGASLGVRLRSMYGQLNCIYSLLKGTLRD